jgi:hypothetical protein
MAVTKDYESRNRGLKDRIIEGLGFASGILIVGHALLFSSGALDVGKDVSVRVHPTNLQTPLR